MPYVYGYARVSTQGQELGRQLDALNEFKPYRIYQEKISGTIKARPALDQMKAELRPGDTLLVESWSRLGRSTKDLIELMDWFHANEIRVKSLKEGELDASTATGKLIFTILASLAAFERDLMVQRTKEGLAAARARGRVGGRPPPPAAKVKKVLALYDSNKLTIAEICADAGVSTNTIYRYLRERKDKQ